MPENPEAVLHRLSDPAVAIVSLTVTEKGYCHDPATGELDESHPLIRSDLSDPGKPRSAIGVLAVAIARRRSAGVAPFTVLCCDNLPANGKTVHRILSRFAGLMSADLGAFVESEIATPSTMVDRITPATTDADRAVVRAALGVDDAWPVVTEPFSQWVVEDRFSAGRPALETVGVEMVSDVAPYEKMKLRLLNGAHSALAYLGSLAGYETVSDAMVDPGLAAFVAALMEDASATLAIPSEAERARYRQSLIARFRNPALRHRLLQIAMDGSQKLPQRILRRRARPAAGKSPGRAARAGRRRMDAFRQPYRCWWRAGACRRSVGGAARGHREERATTGPARSGVVVPRRRFWRSRNRPTICGRGDPGIRLVVGAGRPTLDCIPTPAKSRFQIGTAPFRLLFLHIGWARDQRVMSTVVGITDPSRYARSRRLGAPSSKGALTVGS